MVKRICIFSNTLLSGGAEKQAVLLAKNLQKDHRVILLSYDEKTDPKFQKIIDENEIDVRYLNGNPVAKILNLYQLLKKERIDIIFTYLLKTNLLGGIIGALAGVKSRIGGIRSSRIDPQKIGLQKLLQNSVNTLTVYNNKRAIKLLSEKGFDPTRAVYIPNCVHDIPSKVEREKKSSVIILSVGRFHHAKDYHTAIKAVALLHEKTDGFIYRIIGYGQQESQIRSWIKDYDAGAYIDIVINPSNIEKYYIDADIYFLSSIFEGLSNTVLEAMSYSLPLVLTDVGDNDLLLSNGMNGFMCDPGDHKAMSEALEELLNSHEKRLNYGRESYNRLVNTFSEDIFRQNYNRLIENL
jgi:glycosyltransferase involved in cell wall biosynthesis